MRKTLKELNLSDDFLFAKVMEDEEILKPVLEKILDIKIRRLEIIEPQKTIDVREEAKGIRLDVYADDKDESVFALEMQKRNEYNVAKRSRYYHSAIDIDLLGKGEKYTELRNNIVIFICTYDEFGRGKCKYRFENREVEDTDLRLEDGVTTIFLNTRGTVGNVDDEMKAFLRYVEQSSAEIAEESGSEMIRMIHQKVQEVKANKKYEVEYMNLLEVIDRSFEDGEKSGLEKGLNQGRIEGEKSGLEKGREEAKIEKRESAKAMKQDGVAVDMISKYTGLSREEIEELETKEM